MVVSPAPDFAPYLSGPHLVELEASEATVVGLRPDNSVGYTNSAWARFARENGAPELADWLGGSILNHIAPTLVDFYRRLFERVRSSGEPADHVYQCSSPTRYREFCLRILPLGEDHLLLIHHLAVERPHDGPGASPEASYADAQGIVTQCAHCRRTRRPLQPDTWDWVPAYVEEPLDDVSHGLCPPCVRHYYPDFADDRDQSCGTE